jgi:two-component system phosphate regulon sensor histidine kinase PhoR
MAAEAGVTIEVIGAEAAAEIPGDPDQLTQVLHNLIENAVKYGGAGKRVTVEITRETHVPALRGPGVTVAVIDRGEGIDSIHLPRLTERFYRVDNHRSREKGGTGLGLAIVKHIVNRHRGRLRIESTKGEGSRFSITLPLQ